MANLRPVLLISLLFLGYLLWIEWQKDYGPQAPAVDATASQPAAPVTNTPAVPTGGDLPSRQSRCPPWPVTRLPWPRLAPW